MANNHNFPTVVIDGAAVAGSCSKCGLSRNELLDNAGILMGCQFPDSHQQGSSSSAQISLTAPPNLVRFWNAVNNPDGIIKTGREWVLRDGVQWIGNLGSMLVRDCYVTLADKLLDDVTSIALILGIKGIGKTIFLNYLIVRIIEKFRALNQALPDIVYTWKPDEIKRVLFSAGNGASVLHYSSPAPYYLSDSVDIGDASLGTRLLLEVTSPDASNYRSLIDRLAEGSVGAYNYHMPAWSFDELLFVNPDISEARFLFNVFGGCARYFKPVGQERDRVDDYIQRNAEWFFGPDLEMERPFVWRWALDAIRTRIDKIAASSGGSLATPDIVAISSLFRDPHIQIPGTNTYTTGYTSRFLQFLAGCMEDEADATLWNSLKGIFGASGQGNAFESIGHKTLVRTEQPFIATNLKGKKVRNHRTFEGSFFQMPRKLFRDVKDIKGLKDGQYGIPLACNFALVDAVVQPNTLLQFTTAETHGKPSDEEKYKTLRKQLHGKKDTHKLIFIVKKERMDKFKPSGIPADLQCFKMTY